MSAESLHVETRKRVSNGIVEAWDVACRNGEIVLCGKEIAKRYIIWGQREVLLCIQSTTTQLSQRKGL